MSKIISKRHGQNNSAGGVAPDRSQQKIADHIQSLKNNIEYMAKQESSLDTIDAVVGRPVERLIPRDLLIPAPDDWNFFPKASDDKIKEMSESIRQYGLFHNITVWAQEDGKYMILGGHTRVACFDYLASEESGEKDHEKWTKIPALVYGKDQITEMDAQRIVIVSNTDQRDVSTKTRAKAYMNLFQLEREKAFYGSRFDPLLSAASQANTSKTVFFRYLSLMKLIAELQEAVNNGHLSFMTGYHLSFLSSDLQKFIYDNRIFEQITTQTASQLKKCSTIEEIRQKLRDIERATKYYKYTFQTRNQKSVDEEVLPLFVEKNTRNEMADLYIQAVNESNFPQAIKDKLINTMSSAKIN